MLFLSLTLEVGERVGRAVGLFVGGAMVGRFVMVLYYESHVRIVEFVTEYKE